MRVRISCYGYDCIEPQSLSNICRKYIDFGYIENVVNHCEVKKGLSIFSLFDIKFGN